MRPVTETQQETKTTRLNLGEIGLFCAPWNPTFWNHHIARALTVSRTNISSSHLAAPLGNAGPLSFFANKARRIAANIAKLPGLLRKL
jgi:hypothetical protein